MIVRTWTARAAPSLAPAYADYLAAHVIPALKRLDGFIRLQLLTRESEGSTEIVVQTCWRSLDAIRAFAGADLEAAVVTAEAAALLIDYERRVRHYHVAIDESR